MFTWYILQSSVTSDVLLLWTCNKLSVQAVSTPCLKKNSTNLFFAHWMSNMNRFQWKLEGVSRNKPFPLTKLCLKCPLHLKHVLALPWETGSASLSRQCNNEGHIWMINWIATNLTGSYCLLSLKKSHVTSHHLYYSVCSKCLPPARAQVHRRWCH